MMDKTKLDKLSDDNETKESSVQGIIELNSFQNIKAESINNIYQQYVRNNYVDKKAMDNYREKILDGKRTVKDPITKQTLHKNHKAAKTKYKSKASKYQLEIDHIDPLEDTYNFAKKLPNINDDDIKKVVNKTSNFAPTSKKFNASKKSKTNSKAIKNQDMTTVQKIKSTVQGDVAEFKVKSELIVTSAGREVGNVAQSSLEMSSVIGGKNFAEYLNGEKDLAEATIDTVKDSLRCGVEKKATQQIVNVSKVLSEKIGQKVATKVLANAAGKSLNFISNNLGTIIMLAEFTGKSLVNYINGEISPQRLAQDLTFSAGNAAITIGISQISGTVLASLGTSIAGPVGGIVGKYVGEFIGTIIGTFVAEKVMGTLNEYMNIQDEINEYNHIKNLYMEFAEQVRASRIALESFMDKQHRELSNNIKAGFEQIYDGLLSGDITVVSDGLNFIARQYNIVSQFENKEDFEIKIKNKNFSFNLGNNI